MAAVAEVICDQAKNESGLALIHEAIHGSRDPAIIAGRLNEFVTQASGSTISDGLFHFASVGSVTGVVLRSVCDTPCSDGYCPVNNVARLGTHAVEPT